MLKRVPIVLAVSAAAALGAAPSASATNMTPLVTCVETTTQGYVAHFGYRNDEAFQITKPVIFQESWRRAWINVIFNGTPTYLPTNSAINSADPSNQKLVDMTTINRGQPTEFKPGQYDDVFTVPFTSGAITWALVGRGATASPASPACPTPPITPDDPPVTPDTPSAPVPAAGGGAVTPAATPSPTTGAAKRTCTSRRILTIRIRERKGQKVRSARVVFQNKTIAVSRRTTDGRVVAKIDFRKLPSGRFSVQIRAKLANGKTRTYTRKYYTCKPKFGSANNLGSKTAL